MVEEGRLAGWLTDERADEILEHEGSARRWMAEGVVEPVELSWDPEKEASPIDRTGNTYIVTDPLHGGDGRTLDAVPWVGGFEPDQELAVGGRRYRVTRAVVVEGDTGIAFVETAPG